VAPPVVWVIGERHWPRALLRGELIERGCDAVGFADAARALAAFALPSVDPPRVLVLDLVGAGADERQVRALADLGAPVVLIVGAVEAGRPGVAGVGWARVLRMPVTVGEAADAVAALLH
jgi:hypothetical protein